MRLVKLCICIFLILVSLHNVLLQKPEEQCASKENCGSCIREPGCIWCSAPESNINSTLIRCKHKSALAEGWCQHEHIVEPKNTQEFVQNIPIETVKGKTAVLLSPQKVQLKLRVGEEHVLKFQYAQAEDYPVDLYYIMDLSASMEIHRETLSKLGDQLADTMRKLTSKFRLGFGSFVDKTELPFVSTVPDLLKRPCDVPNSTKPCAPPYGFRNHLSLTADTKIFSEKVNKAVVSGNLDAPEGGLDAIMQAMVCKDTINWRPKARHLLVFSTDATFHIAGDGKLAGIVEPNDGLCHMENDEYTYSLVQDYPSIGQINEKAIENNVNIIFAVTQSQHKIYNELKMRIKEASIGILSGSSGNIVNLVKDVYNKIVDSVKISDNFDNILEVKYFSDCNGIPNENTHECKNLRIGSKVEFTTSIKLLNCPSNRNFTRTYRIRPGALSESLTVEVEMLCDCPCERPGNTGFEQASTNCNNAGNLTCGVCNCLNGKYGVKCECDGQTTVDVEDFTNCQKDKGTEVCSGVGTCKCGKCECNKRTNPLEVISGKHCECNNFSCKRNSGLLCSGSSHGVCECGKCTCFSGWTGEACECSNNNDTCIAPGNENADICSNNGECVCGQCQCKTVDDNLYSGRYCEECPSCAGQRCDELRYCVECQAFESGRYSSSECKAKCTGYPINIIEKVDNATDTEKICRFPINGCTFIFKYSYVDNTDLVIQVQKDIVCNENIDVIAVVAWVIGSILLAGIVMLIMWKILTTIHDRREYAKFENERKNAQWQRGENPLFKHPTTHFKNPMYNS